MAHTVDGLFLAALADHPERVFLRHLMRGGIEDRETYADGAKRIAGIVEGLRGLGIRTGDRVLAYVDEARPSLYFTLACAHAGIIMVPLSPTFSVDAVRRLSDRIAARGVFTTLAHAPRLLDAGMTTLCLGAPAVSRADGLHVLPIALSMDSGRALEILRRAASEHDGDAPYFLLPTSGTTGEPKLPIRTHRAAAHRGPKVAAWLGAKREEPSRFLLVAALTHSFAHTVVATGLSLATEFSIPSEIDTAAPLDEIRELDPTHIFATPRVIRSLYRQHAEQGGQPGERLFGPSARALRLTGAPSDESNMRDLLTQGVDVGEIYGASECGTVVVTPVMGWRSGSAGTPLPGVTLRIAEDGEILIRCEGESVAYYGEEELTREATTDDGFYRTSDCGQLDADGYLRIVGRKRDVFNTHEGSNVYPQRIEALIEGLPFVHQTVLVGDQRPFFGALIVVKDDVLKDSNAKGSDWDGYLDETQFPELYERVRSDLGRVNRKLEAIEHVRRFALFGRPMGPDLYSWVQAGKARRVRTAIQATYGTRIEALYSPTASKAASVPD